MAEHLVLRDLLAGGWRELEFAPFKPGITIHWLQQGEPAVALLRYAPGARAPLHLHEAVETILVLEGSQSDAFGDYEAGSYVINLPGSQHEVWSEHGCTVLLHWAKPVRFL
ncbi:MAG: cupin domain-containing protein [Mangrovicoccus sp.]|nr:cupin domain-containing protein [Mangrovicoccus sp.]